LIAPGLHRNVRGRNQAERGEIKPSPRRERTRKLSSGVADAHTTTKRTRRGQAQGHCNVVLTCGDRVDHAARTASSAAVVSSCGDVGRRRCWCVRPAG
jgi:hypothetical protein